MSPGLSRRQALALAAAGFGGALNAQSAPPRSATLARAWLRRYGQ